MGGSKESINNVVEGIVFYKMKYKIQPTVLTAVIFIHSLTLLHCTQFTTEENYISIQNAQHVLDLLWLMLERPKSGGVLSASECFLWCSLSPSAGRCWWCSHSWKEMLAFLSHTAWLTARPPKPLWETGPRLKPPTARSSPQTLMACTGPGHYDHRPLCPCTHTDSNNPMNCQTTGKPGRVAGKWCAQPQDIEKRCVWMNTHLNV